MEASPSSPLSDIGGYENEKGKSEKEFREPFMTTSKRVKTTPANMSAIGNSLIRYMDRGEGLRVEVSRVSIVGLKKFRFGNQGADLSHTWES